MTTTIDSSLPLAGYLALDLTDEKGLECGKIPADLGMDVIQIEPPGGVRCETSAHALAGITGKFVATFWDCRRINIHSLRRPRFLNELHRRKQRCIR